MWWKPYCPPRYTIENRQMSQLACLTMHDTTCTLCIHSYTPCDLIFFITQLYIILIKSILRLSTYKDETYVTRLNDRKHIIIIIVLTI